MQVVIADANVIPAQVVFLQVGFQAFRESSLIHHRPHRSTRHVAKKPFVLTAELGKALIANFPGGFADTELAVA